MGELERRGWGLNHSTMNARMFMINGAGVAAAAAIRKARTPKSLTDRLASDKTQKLMNVGAFVTSLISLVVAVIALARSGG